MCEYFFHNWMRVNKVNTVKCELKKSKSTKVSIGVFYSINGSKRKGSRVLFFLNLS